MPRASANAGVSLAPMLSVRRGADAVAFYKAAFGANELFKIEDGGSVVAQLAVQGAKFWVGRVATASEFQPGDPRRCNSSLRLGSGGPGRLSR